MPEDTGVVAGFGFSLEAGGVISAAAGKLYGVHKASPFEKYVGSVKKKG